MKKTHKVKGWVQFTEEGKLWIDPDSSLPFLYDNKNAACMECESGETVRKVEITVKVVD